MRKQELKNWERKGNLFFNKGIKKKGDYVEFDLDCIKLLHTGVDTVRQLFRGTINTDWLGIIDSHLSNNHRYPLTFGDYDFIVSKGSKLSGFQYILKNLELGLVVLIKNFHADSDTVATHLKVEYSPHLLLSNSPADIDQISLDVASIFMLEFEFSDIAVHLAVDIKGYEIPANLERNLRTKARRSFSFKGISQFEYDIHAVALKYGSNESYTFGSTGSIQFCIYDKTKEAGVRDKLSFWIEQWSKTLSVENFPLPEFQKQDDVVRLEARFHHSVVRQFCKGTRGFEATTYSQLAPHLTGLWKYFLDAYRLHHSKHFVDPLWQLLEEDVFFHSPCKPLFYKRDYKGGSGTSKRNVAFWIGNALRLFSRQSFNTDFVVKYFIDSGLLVELKDYLKLPPNATGEELSMVLHEFVHKRMTDHLMNGVAV